MTPSPPSAVPLLTTSECKPNQEDGTQEWYTIIRGDPGLPASGAAGCPPCSEDHRPPAPVFYALPSWSLSSEGDFATEILARFFFTFLRGLIP